MVIPMTRRYSAMLMAMFLVAVYWANLNMWINDIPIDDNMFEPIWHILRLIGQLLMITVALWVGNWLPKGGVHE